MNTLEIATTVEWLILATLGWLAIMPLFSYFRATVCTWFGDYSTPELRTINPAPLLDPMAAIMLYVFYTPVLWPMYVRVDAIRGPWRKAKITAMIVMPIIYMFAYTILSIIALMFLRQHASWVIGHNSSLIIVLERLLSIIVQFCCWLAIITPIRDILSLASRSFAKYYPANYEMIRLGTLAGIILFYVLCGHAIAMMEVAFLSGVAKSLLYLLN